MACGLTIAALAGVFTLWSARPLVIGVLFLVVLLWVVEVPDSAVGRHPLVVLPILFWLWANVHGSFALGFAYLALHLLGGWVDHRRPWEARERTLLVGAAIAFVVVFANPYGAELVLFPIALLARGDILSHIVEWQSPDFREIFGLALALWIGVFVWAVARGRNGVSRRDLIVTLPFLFLALWALRNVAVAPLVGLPVASRALARDPRPLAFRRSFLALTSAVIVLVAAVVGMSAAAEPDFRLGSYPVGAMRYLERHDLLGRRLLLDDADAGYTILAYFPAQRIFIDDRYDMYPSSVIDDYFDLAAADRDWSRILDRRGVDVVVWERDDPLAVLLDTSPTWARVHRDGSRAVWVRQS